MRPLVRRLALALLFPAALAAAAPVAAQSRAYAPEDLRTLSYGDQVRVIELEYQEQSGGRRIPDDQLRFYLDQVNRSNWGFSQIRSDIARSLGGGATPLPGTGQTIRCESEDGRAATCRTPWPGHSRLVRQLSKSPCDEGRSWQSQRGQVDVGNGCRAEFAEALGPAPVPGTETVRCESTDGRARTCQVPWFGGSRLVRQLSRTECVEGRTWHSQRGQVLVNGGCRGEFGAGAGQDLPVPLPGAGTIACESLGTAARTCDTPWAGTSRLVRTLPGSRDCRDGRSWGTRAGQVWVQFGCRAEFAPVDAYGPGAGAGYSVTCTSRGGPVPTTCAWDPRHGVPVLLELLPASTRCTQGRTWGYDTGRVWVSGGCRARFGAR